MNQDNENIDIAFDKIGQPVKKGDKIIYGRSQGDGIHFGTVDKVMSPSRIRVKNDDTGRVSVNDRDSCKVLQVDYLREVMPEYFL